MIALATIKACIHERHDGYSTTFTVFLNDDNIGQTGDKAAAAALVRDELAKRIRDGKLPEDHDLRYHWHYTEVTDG